MSTEFRELQIHDWRQFGHIGIAFHPRLTVLTGANGAGKSTLLNILNRHFGWNREILAVPQRSKSGTLSYLNGLITRVFRSSRDIPASASIGNLRYANGAASDISLGASTDYQVSLQMPSMQSVEGIFIDSHRPIPRYQPVSQMPLAPMTAQQSFSNYNQEMLNVYSGGYGQGPLFRMKESIISMGILVRATKRLAVVIRSLRLSMMASMRYCRDYSLIASALLLFLFALPR